MDVVLTSEGLAAIQAAARSHVAAVRETFIDRLSATVIDGLHNPSHCPNGQRSILPPLNAACCDGRGRDKGHGLCRWPFPQR